MLPNPPPLTPSSALFVFCGCMNGSSLVDATSVPGCFPIFPVSTIASSFALLSSRLLTSLALRRPRMGAPPFSPGLSTATKLVRTLLTGLLWFEISDGLGERPRLGGDVDWSVALFSNIARRFLTPPLPELADMVVDAAQNQQSKVSSRCKGDAAEMATKQSRHHHGTTRLGLGDGRAHEEEIE